MNSPLTFLEQYIRTASLDPSNRSLKVTLHPRSVLSQVSLTIYRASGCHAINDGLDIELIGAVPAHSVVALHDALTQPIALQLKTDQGRWQTVAGLITSIELGASDGAASLVRLRVQDGLQLIAQRKNTRVFTDLTDLDIALALLDEWKARHPAIQSFMRVDTSKVTASLPRRPFVLQYHESDRDFMLRRLAKVGISVSMRSALSEASPADNLALTHTLLLTDASATLLPQNGAERVRFHRTGGTESRDTVQTFGMTHHMGPISVSRAQWMPEQARSDEAQSYQRPTAANALARQSALMDDFGLTTPLITHADATLADEVELRIMGYEQASAWFSGTSTVRDFEAGTWFTLDGHPDLARIYPTDPAANELMIHALRFSVENNLSVDAHTSMNYLIDQSGWSVPLSGLRLDNSNLKYRNQFIARRRSVPVVPAIDALGPPPPASLVATVVGPQSGDGRSRKSGGEEVYTNEWGQVRIQLQGLRADDHPNRLGTERMSAWVDVLTPASGRGFGASHLPRIGETVMVQFLNADPDYPVVVGRMNHRYMEPVQFNGVGNLPDNRYLSGLRSKEIGAQRANQLQFDDTKGELGLKLSSDEGASQLNLGHITYPRQGSATQRGVGFELRTDEYGAVRAGKGLLITTYEQTQASNPTLVAVEAHHSLEQGEQVLGSLSMAAEQHRLDALAALGTLRQYIDSLPNQPANPAELQGFQDALMLLASAAGIALTTPADIHLNSGQHMTLASAQAITLGAARDLALAAAEKINLFAVKRGVALTAVKGDIHLEAQSDHIGLRAKQDIRLQSVDAKIDLSAAKEITLSAGGSQLRINAQGISLITPREYSVKAAIHKHMGPGSAPPPKGEFPECQSKQASAAGTGSARVSLT